MICVDFPQTTNPGNWCFRGWGGTVGTTWFKGNRFRTSLTDNILWFHKFSNVQTLQTTNPPTYSVDRSSSWNVTRPPESIQIVSTAIFVDSRSFQPDIVICRRSEIIGNDSDNVNESQPLEPPAPPDWQVGWVSFVQKLRKSTNIVIYQCSAKTYDRFWRSWYVPTPRDANHFRFIEFARKKKIV